MLYEATLDPTALAEPRESEEAAVEPEGLPAALPPQPLAQVAGARFETTVEHTVRAVVSWYRLLPTAACDENEPETPPHQSHQNYTIIYHPTQNTQPQETQTKVSSVPFVVLTDLKPNQDYVFEVISWNASGDVMWSAKDHLSTG